MENSKFRRIDYNADEISVTDVTDFNNLKIDADNHIHWIDLNDLRDKESIQALCKSFGIHRLIAEDILNVNQMVKMDNYDDCLFIVLKMPRYDSDDSSIAARHVSIILKENCVFSFQEFGGDIFSSVTEKLKSGRDYLRKQGADYLCYELINLIVDSYFSVIDELGDTVDSIEEELVVKPTKSTLQTIYLVKRKLMYLRKSAFPLRELIDGLFRTGSPLIGEGVKIYFHDIYDHLIQIVDAIETYQDILSNMLDIYLSSISNKTNDTMKILTIFSTIFIPLTFLSGIFGMNFSFMPGLDYVYGYYIFWGICVAIALMMMMFFHKKKWF